ncbi:SMI1/KNR4 family protein [Serratia nevei]|uniref:SMI1/KNR4 family protein n=1 Tax=Serratia nevei TaxID=2703794 RepID=UPI00344E8A98
MVRNWNSNHPIAISDITDFKEIVCFGEAGDGSPFCFDFRDSPECPAVIWWDDDYWRKISDSFEDFSSFFHARR